MPLYLSKKIICYANSMNILGNFKVTKNKLYVTTLLLLASALRLINLGYSNFQGDEIKALFITQPNESVYDFLLSQRKGPIQFLITYLLKIFDPNYTNEFLIRLPFAIAGILVVYFFYKLLQEHFNEKIAFYASFFVATNGFFVAFSRIVQYQSFVILFMILALYMFTLASKQEKYKTSGLYFGFIFWALSILSHYDGVLIFPFVIYILANWLKSLAFNFTKLFDFSVFKNLKHLFRASLIFLILVFLFYIPFALNIDSGTQSYWQGRFSGTGGKISSSLYLFSVYQPIYVVHIYTALAALGFIKVFLDTFGSIIFARLVPKLGFIKGKYKTAGTLLLLLLNDNFQKSLALFFWFAVPFIFMEVIVNIPGTHIYNYLLPLTVFLAFGIAFIEESVVQIVTKALKMFRRTAKNLIYLTTVLTSFGIFIVFTFIALQSYAVFVDNSVEYPWSSKKFLVWEFPRPSPIYHLSMFGFPYYRDWEGVGKFVTKTHVVEGEKIEFYSTNERKSISRFHIPFAKDTNSSGYFIYVHNPQSFTRDIIYEKADYWVQNYEPVASFAPIIDPCAEGFLVIPKKNCVLSSQTEPTMGNAINVYYMPTGSLDEIVAQGF